MKTTRILTSKLPLLSAAKFSNQFVGQSARKFSTEASNLTKSKWQNLKEKTTLGNIGRYSILTMYTGLLVWSGLALISESRLVSLVKGPCDLDSVLGKDLSRSLYRDWASSINSNLSENRNLDESRIQTKQLVENIYHNLKSLYKSAHNEAYNYPALKSKPSKNDLEKLEKISEAIESIDNILYSKEEDQRKALGIMSKKFFSKAIAEENAKLNSDEKQMGSIPSHTPCKKTTKKEQDLAR